MKSLKVREKTESDEIENLDFRNCRLRCAGRSRRVGSRTKTAAALESTRSHPARRSRSTGPIPANYANERQPNGRRSNRRSIDAKFRLEPTPVPSRSYRGITILASPYCPSETGLKDRRATKATRAMLGRKV